MIVDFDRIQEEKIRNFRGGEREIFLRLFTDGGNKIMYGRLKPGASVGVHTHGTSSEMVYILEGAGTALYDGKAEAVRPGLCHYCPQGHSHSLVNDGAEDLVFFAVVPQAPV